MLTESLFNLGLNQKEIDVYLAVLRQGKATPTDISKVSGVNRTTVYSVAKNLIEKGLIHLDQKGKIHFLAAKSPEELLDMVEREKMELKKKEKVAQDAIKELSALTRGQQFSIPKIQLIEEKKLEQFLYKRMPEWVTNNRKYQEKWWGFQDHTILEKYGEWIEWTWNAFPDLDVKLLSNETELERKMEKRVISRREIKFWEKTKDFSGTLWVAGDYLIMVVTRTRPHYLVEINDAVLAANQRELFKGLWQEVKSEE